MIDVTSDSVIKLLSARNCVDDPDKTPLIQLNESKPWKALREFGYGLVTRDKPSA